MDERATGLIAFYGKENVASLLRKALDALRHRAWGGYEIHIGDGEHFDEKDLSDQTAAKCMVAASCSMSFADGMTLPFHGQIYDEIESDFLSKLSRFASYMDFKSASSLLEKVEGDYSFAYPTERGLFVGRSILGVKPLYLAYRAGLVAVSSEAKGLKSVGLESVKSLEPGYVYSINLEGIVRHRIGEALKLDALNVGLDEACMRICDLVEQSVKKRIRGRVNKVAIGFSGGVDSSLLALLASRYTDILLISVCTKGSRDEDYVKKAAKMLGLDLELYTLDYDYVSSKIGLIKWLVEEDSTMDLSIALAVYTVAYRARELGVSNIMLGQLADELFGGYARHYRIYVEKGAEAVSNQMLYDVCNTYRLNFERDEKASSPFVDLILPYASLPLSRYALGLNPDLKFSKNDGTRKLVLREAALRMGVSRSLAFSPKKALQYSSGLHKLVSKLCHNRKFKPI